MGELTDFLAIHYPIHQNWKRLIGNMQPRNLKKGGHEATFFYQSQDEFDPGICGS